MIPLKRNQRTIYISNFIREEPLLDEEGYDTGETVEVYTDPIEIKANIREETGEIKDGPFGKLEKYDRIIGPLSNKLNIKPNTRIYIGVDPKTEPHNFIVSKVSESLSHKMIVAKKVTLNEDEN